ncbi:MAG: ATP-binding cassette domain-containing protein [Allomuricauda sp.]
MSKLKNHSITVRNLTIGYTTKTVSDNINFSVDSGQLCAIVGVNGVGKSTLLRTLGRLQPKLSGEITVNRKALERYSSFELAKTLSFVLTEQPASKNLTVQELIALGRQPYTNWIGTLTSEDKRQVEESLSSFY